MEEGGVKYPEKLPTSLMDGPQLLWTTLKFLNQLLVQLRKKSCHLSQLNIDGSSKIVF